MLQCEIEDEGEVDPCEMGVEFDKGCAGEAPALACLAFALYSVSLCSESPKDDDPQPFS